MKVGSLFSGVGGLDLGLARAGHEHVFFCESDAYRRDVLRARLPGVPVYEDVRTLGESTWGIAADRAGASVDLGRWEAGPGLLCGGFPCQDLSVAGRRRGLAGDRSGLFFEFARIAATLRPEWLLVENVPGLLSSNGGRDFGVLLGTLADLGYGLAWRTLDSRFFGVPQRRRRVFIVGALADGDPRAAAERAGEVLAVGSGCPRHLASRGQAGPSVAKSFAGRSPSRLDDAAVGGGQLVPDRYYVEDSVNGTLKANGSGGFPRTDRQRLLVAAPLTKGSATGDGVNQPGRRQEDDVNIVTNPGIGVRRLTPRECERLQGFPDDWTQLGDTPDSRRYSALGDAVTVNVAEWIGGRLAA